jgi:hypothetical protein
MIDYERIYVDPTVVGDIKIKTTGKSGEQVIYIKSTDVEKVAAKLLNLIPTKHKNEGFKP